jgi:hypothetical protein
LFSVRNPFSDSRLKPDECRSLESGDPAMSEPLDPKNPPDSPLASADSGRQTTGDTTVQASASVRTDGSHPVADSLTRELPEVPGYRVLGENKTGKLCGHCSGLGRLAFRDETVHKSQPYHGAWDSGDDEGGVEDLGGVSDSG